MGMGMEMEKVLAAGLTGVGKGKSCLYELVLV